MIDSVNVRDLEQIQESDPRRPAPRVLSLALFGVATAAVVTASVMVSRRSGPSAKSTRDPLAALVQKAKHSPQKPEQLNDSELSFPDILSDSTRPTTALAAVKDERGRLLEQASGLVPPVDDPAFVGEPPTPGDSLPVVPLPVGTLLNATTVTHNPKDELVRLAAQTSDVETNEELAPPGTDSGYQIQVASFKQQSDADALVEQLRRRGHSAFRLAAQIPGRGVWHRVRIGPFKTRFKALQYQKKFERTERMSPFLVDPDKVKRAEEIREARLKARLKKYGRP